MHLFLIMGPRVMITIISIQIWYPVHFSWNSYSLQKCIYEWEIIQTKQRQEREKKTQANYIEWNFVFEIQPMKIMVDN